MPNHITNLLTITGDPEKVAAFRAAHIATGERGPYFSFESVIPKPQCVTDTERPFEPGKSFGDATVEIYARALLENRQFFVVERIPHAPPTVQRWGDVIEWLDREYPGVDKWARASLRCAAETGHPGWYEWSNATWGTKWGAYQYAERSFEPGRFVFEFQTAWSSPRPIFDALADHWPELAIHVEAIDEGGGEYEGRYCGAARTFGRVDDDVERYRRVYGHDPYSDEDEDDSDPDHGAVTEPGSCTDPR